MDTKALLPKKPKRRRAWPTAADDARVEAIALLARIGEAASVAQDAICDGDAQTALRNLQLILDKARAGAGVLKRAKDL